MFTEPLQRTKKVRSTGYLEADELRETMTIARAKRCDQDPVAKAAQRVGTAKTSRVTSSRNATRHELVVRGLRLQRKIDHNYSCSCGHAWRFKQFPRLYTSPSLWLRIALRV